MSINPTNTLNIGQNAGERLLHNPDALASLEQKVNQALENTGAEALGVELIQQLVAQAIKEITGSQVAGTNVSQIV